MKKLIIIGLAFAGLLFSCSGNTEKVSAYPERIISLSPHITEIIYELKVEKKLVAVTDYCNYPPDAKNKTRIGGLLNPNIEKIIALQPDLLIGTPAHADLAGKLSDHNLEVLLLPNDSMDDVYSSIDSISIVLGRENEGRALNRSIRDSLAYYRTAAGKLRLHDLEAMFVIGRDVGTTRNITVAGPTTFIESLWTMLGHKNAFRDLPARYAQANREAILIKKPEIIIEFKFNEIWNEQKNQENWKEWQKLSGIPAVDKNNIFVLTGNYTLIPGPRLYLLARDYVQVLRDYQAN